MNGALAIAPILIPLATAAAQVLLGVRFRRLRAGLSFLSCLALVAIAALLMASASDGEGKTLVYNLGNWPARFAIVLVVAAVPVGRGGRTPAPSPSAGAACRRRASSAAPAPGAPT